MFTLAFRPDGQRTALRISSPDRSMNVTLNGRSQTLAEPLTVADLLHRLDLEPVRVAVEVNEELVPRKRFAEAALQEGDRIEIVTLVGGG